MNWINNIRPKIRSLLHHQAGAARQSVGQVPRHRADGLLQGPGGQPVRHPRLQLPHAHGGAASACSISSTTANTSRCRCARLPQDPLKFRDGKRYTDRLKTAKADTELDDAVLVGEGKLEGQDVVAAAQDFRFMAGSLGMAAGEAVIAGMLRAVEKRTPVHPVCRLGRGAHAGGHPLAHADAAHHHRRADAARGAPALPRGAHRPDHRRRHAPPTPCWATCTSPSPAR